MKKGLYLILCLLLMPISVNADMGAPSISEYEVLVSNLDGVKLYEYKNGDYITTIPYDTLLTIIYEESSNNILYGYTDYDGEYGYIDLSNTQVYSTDIDFSSFMEGNGTQVYVYKDGCLMYSGPSQTYGTNGVEIPVGTNLEILYHDEVWSYVEYNGVSGWIYTYEYESDYDLYENIDVAVAYYNTDASKLITTKNITEIYSDDFSSKISINISELTVLEYDYYIDYIYHITYNGVSGWVYAGYGDASVMPMYEENILTYDKVSLYERNSYMTYTKTSITLPVNYKTQASCWYEYENEYQESYTVCQISYNNDIYYVINRYDYSGLLDTIESTYVKTRDDNYYVIISKDLDLYDEINGSVVVTIPEGTSLEVKYYLAYIDDDNYDNYIYVTYNDVSGWLKYENEYMTGYYEDDDNNGDTITVDDYDEEPEVDNESNVFSEILVAFIVALVIALTAIVLTIYINKKKDKGNVSN